MRRLWIQRISAGAKNLGTSYSRLMNTLKVKECKLNRKMLSEIAISEPKAFDEIAKLAKAALEKQSKKSV